MIVFTMKLTFSYFISYWSNHRTVTSRPSYRWQLGDNTSPGTGPFLSHLLIRVLNSQQLESFRGAVRFLRMENSYLKGDYSMRELGELPPLAVPTSRPRLPTPPLDESGLSDTDESDAESSPKDPSVRTLTTETKALYREVIKFSSTPRVVDLSARKTDEGNTKAWIPKKKTPTYQVWERKAQAAHLSRRVQGLLERTSAMKIP